MRYDVHLIFFFIGVGLLTRKLTWRGWVGIGFLIFFWLMFNWQKG